MIEEARKWAAAAKDITATTALIIIVLWLVYQSTGARNEALYAAKASVEEAVNILRRNEELVRGHAKMASEDSSLMHMIMIQICINSADGDRAKINVCLNYR